MNAHAEKSQENKSQTMAKTVSNKQSGGDSAFQFVDKRRETAEQKSFYELANNPTQINPATQLRAMAKSYSARLQPLIQKKENNTGLLDNLKYGIENLSGYLLDDVNVNYNSDKPAQLNAHAYAQGTNIHLAPGQEKHLPHEAWHVVQQKQGRVKPTLQMKGNINVNDDTGLETEADVMGEKAIYFNEVVQSKSARYKNGFYSDSTVSQLQQNHSVIQYRLTNLNSKEVSALKGGNEGYFSSFIKSLQVYEGTSDQDFEDLCSALDRISVDYKILRDYLEDLVDNKGQAELEETLIKLFDFNSELKTEIKVLVRNLPMEKLEKWKAHFDGKGMFNHIIEEIWENEPQLNSAISVSNTSGKKVDLKTEYKAAKGKPFEGEPKVEDVKQGFIGDCWIMAPLISIVNTVEGRDRIKKMIQPNNKESAIYTVTLQEENEDGKGYTETKIDILSRFPSSNGKFVFALQGFKIPDDQNSVPLWPAILEKAFAKSSINSDNLKNYLGLDSGQGASKTLSSVLGKDAGGKLINDIEIIKLVNVEKRPVTVCTDTHYYSVLSADSKGVMLRNPHGKNEEYNWKDLQIKFKQYNTDSKVGMW